MEEKWDLNDFFENFISFLKAFLEVLKRSQKRTFLRSYFKSFKDFPPDSQHKLPRKVILEEKFR